MNRYQIEAKLEEVRKRRDAAPKASTGGDTLRNKLTLEIFELEQALYAIKHPTPEPVTESAEQVAARVQARVDRRNLWNSLSQELLRYPQGSAEALRCMRDMSDLSAAEVHERASGDAG